MASFDRDDSFEVENGVLISNSQGVEKAGYFSGTGDPTLSGGTPAPVGSVFARNDAAETWIKFDTPDIAWTRIDYGSLPGGNSFPFRWLANGAANNQWLEPGNGLTPERNQHVVPWRCKVVGITFDNEKDDPDFDVEIYKAPQGGGSDPMYFMLKWEIRGGIRAASKTGMPTEIILEPGDRLGCFIRKKIKEPTDPHIAIYFSFVDGPFVAETYETFSNHFNLLNTIDDTNLVTINTTRP